jgi:hypothetical protein
MTYNFDPDAWYERELQALQLRLQRGEIDDAQYAALCDQAAQQYDAMQASLNATIEYK